MSSTQPYLTLNNGVRMPAIGLGVYQSPPEETTDAVATALRAGYRHVDTAAAYFNEREVGDALKQSGVDRSEVFLETKIWMSDYGFEETLHGFEKSRRKLDVEHIDLLILHQPLADEFDKTVAAYKALETLLADGRLSAIGVSNFDPSQLDELVSRTAVVPAVNQIEVHPYFTQPEWRAANDRHGILTQAWSPIGGSYVYNDHGAPNPLEDEVVVGLASKYGKTSAQVMLRWHIEHGFSAIPKSVKPHRIIENFDVFDFTLTRDEVEAMDRLDTGVRGGPDSNTLNLENFGFPIPSECHGGAPAFLKIGRPRWDVGGIDSVREAVHDPVAGDRVSVCRPASGLHLTGEGVQHVSTEVTTSSSGTLNPRVVDRLGRVWIGWIRWRDDAAPQPPGAYVGRPQ